MRKSLLYVALLAATVLSTTSAQAEKIFGLTSSNQIFVMANASAPSSIAGPYSVTGMASTESLIALDFNPANGMLYALGYDATATQAHLYTVNTSTWSLSAVGSSALSMNLGDGMNAGFDFMSTASNRIRVVASNGSNYILDAMNGSIAATGSSTITYAASDIHSGSSGHIGATAFTNSYYGADATNEIGYDVTTNTVVIFDMTNMYSVHTAGLSGITTSVGSSVGIDASYDATTHNNTIYLTATPTLGAGAVLYTVNPSTGTAASVGVVGSGTVNVRDIAVEVTRNVPATITGQLIIGLTLNMRNLIFFDSDNPSVIRKSISLQGVASGQTMMAITVSPQNRKLYGIAYNVTTTAYQLYTIDTTTGSVTAINSTTATLNLGSNSNAAVGMSFNPKSGYIQVTGNGGLNVEIDAATGIVAATDSNFYYASGDAHAGASANIGSIAFTNSYAGSTNTHMTGVDFNTGAIVSLSASSKASLSTVLDITAILGIGTNSNGNIDFYYDSTTASDKVFMSSNANGFISGTDNFAKFYKSSSPSTTPTYVGDMNTPVKSMAVQKKYAGTTGIGIVTGSNAGSNLLVYPNPVTDHTHIVLNAPAKFNVIVTITDMNGQVVRTSQYAAGSTTLDVDMSGLATGNYIATVNSKDLLHRTQLLKL